MKKKRPDFSGCPRCGSKRRERVSGFDRCKECEYVYGSNVVGSDHWTKIDRDGRMNLPAADAQGRAPRKRGRDYVGVDRHMRSTLGELETKKR